MKTKSPRTASIAATVHKRVTKSTPPPYVARVHDGMGRPTQILVFVTSLERSHGMPTFARATVLTSRPGSIYYKAGDAVKIDNFSCLQRFEITAVSDA